MKWSDVGRWWLLGLGLVSLIGCGGGGGGGFSGNRGDSEEFQPIGLSAPTEHWGLSRATPESVGISTEKVGALVDYVFTDGATQSVVVSKDGYVIGERYASGFDAQSYGTSWSVAKSIYSAAVGVAISEGHFSSVEQKASSVLSEFLGTDKEDITLRQILQMRSGLASNTDVFFSGDQTAHALANTLTAQPGTRYDYSNANSQLFEPLLARATGMDAHSYVLEKILQPIGIDPDQYQWVAEFFPARNCARPYPLPEPAAARKAGSLHWSNRIEYLAARSVYLLRHGRFGHH